MKTLRLATVLVLSLFVAGCFGANTTEELTSGEVRLQIIEGIDLFNRAGALTAKTTETMGRQGVIGWQEACKVEQYSWLAMRISDEALAAAIMSDLDKAQVLFETARRTFSGIGEEAARLAADNCAGN